MKEAQADIFINKEVIEFAFSGDSLIEFVTKNPEVMHAKTLLLESTYIDEKRPVSRAREWGHTHLDEIIELLPDLHCDRIILTHFSRRYRKAQIEERLKNKLRLSSKK